MKILLFGIAKDIIGSSVLDWKLEDEGSTSSELLVSLKTKYPELSKLRSIALAVNGEHALGEEILKKGDEVALIPPMSGG
ncbi:MoaD/ThiS family protein [Flammeovirga kamogawensis]|uniref:Molybdopterin synthase sulfur carrier subunit n=1 Tax=Flammeovirga kamogawensis TaxID=373891 RepID=A0ABX8GVN1_9BACT|nr:MoaD/ThiS family protein [Flammeovirga kamogawensis]MBB6461687.1 molybdopterin synthase sulfur carrier subunit [Flammeovirga kamogawensis]QWG07388.1 MoaD/ThiS family protein [Flammeovirga kamogawensis]TRX69201.1 MoaD/ThiS family protein [Flammeovirga kamogawensis]